jgi:hypothetical protein
MPRTLRIAFALAATALIVAIPATASAEGPSASASRTCSLKGQQRDFPPASYVTSLRVFNTSCRKGKSVIRGYHKCRKANGGANGRCPNRVLRFRCTEGARQAVPGVQYNATVTCRRGTRKIVSTYTQNV